MKSQMTNFIHLTPRTKRSLTNNSLGYSLSNRVKLPKIENQRQRAISTQKYTSILSPPVKQHHSNSPQLKPLTLTSSPKQIIQSPKIISKISPDKFIMKLSCCENEKQLKQQNIRPIKEDKFRSFECFDFEPKGFEQAQEDFFDFSLQQYLDIQGVHFVEEQQITY